MDASFHAANRARLMESLPEEAMAVLFAGAAPRQSADAYYPFFASRNYLYLTGVDFENLILVLQKTGGEERQTLYILPKDPLHERWNGRRYSAEEARTLSGIEDIRYLEAFEDDFQKEAQAGRVESLWLDLFKHRPDEADDAAHRFAGETRRRYPWLRLENLLPAMRRLRTIKAPCEIEAMQRAMTITREGIVTMMRTSHPGMYEYEYKAAFDYALTKNGVLTPAFPPIISAGENNFCIHYYSYTGKAQDGDMILNDVGAQWDNEANDISRGWPANGKFSKEQAALYSVAYDASNHLFATIKPGMPMSMVDETVRRTVFEGLKNLGLLRNYEDIGKYVWHGGTHHVGYDVHDMVELDIDGIRPGMVFCVDVGIYCQEWGIGFRLEDNCLVTENGCINLSTSVPRSIEDIEAVMADK